MYPHVLVVQHWVIKVIIEDVRRQVTGTFLGVGDDGVEEDIEVEKADFWGASVAVVGEFVATDCQTNAVCFSLGELDVVDKFGIGYFFLSLGMVCFETKKIVLVPSMCLGGRRDLPPTCAKREKSLLCRFP